MRKPGAFGRLLQMKPFLDLEQPFDAHAPGEVAGPFEANDPSVGRNNRVGPRSEEHTSELQSLMRISYAVFCLKKKKKNTTPSNNKKTLAKENTDSNKN